MSNQPSNGEPMVVEEPARLIFICSDGSGSGKSSISIGLLDYLLSPVGGAYLPSQVAYIKPATQCKDVQLVSKYCNEKGVEHVGLGPVIFYPGFTSECIDAEFDEESSTSEASPKRWSNNQFRLLTKVLNAVAKISKSKKIVIVDGVGFAAVGSVTGVGNGDMASFLGAPALLIGKPGLGFAIDSCNMMRTYLSTFSVPVLGACWNKFPEFASYHSRQDCANYISKYYSIRNHAMHVYGFIPLVPPPADLNTATVQATPAVAATPGSAPKMPVCLTRPTKTDLEFSIEERVFLEKFLLLMKDHFNFKVFFDHVSAYYAEHPPISLHDRLAEFKKSMSIC